MQQVIDAVKNDLRGRARSTATVIGRPKQYYSIYQKMVVRGREFDDIYDLVGIRILVDSRCATATPCSASIHARWTPMPGRFKDYIATPKFNLYQSLHTTVIGPAGQAGRDPDPHARRCTSAPSTASPRTGSTRSDVARRHDRTRRRRVRRRHGLARAICSTGRRETADPSEFLDSLRFEIGAKEVYVFTPKGEVIGLPDRRDPRRLRLRGPHRGRAPHDGRQGQRPARAAGVARSSNGDVVEVFTSK